MIRSFFKSRKILMQCTIALFMMVTSITSAQKNPTKIIQGKLLSDGKFPGGVDVVNLVNEKATISDAQGNFTIEASAGDLLVISGKEFEYMRYSIDTDDLLKPLLTIKLITKAIQLEETVVNQYSHINSRDLGIIPANTKVYTPAERKLAAASSGPIDLVAGLISGSLDRKKKEAEVERKEFLLERLDILYTDSYYTTKLKIPHDQIGSFKFFAAEDAMLRASVIGKDKNLIEFELSRLANSFMKL